MQISPVGGSSLPYPCSSHAHKTKKSRLALNPGKTTARFSHVHFNSFLPVVVTQTKMHCPSPLESSPCFRAGFPEGLLFFGFCFSTARLVKYIDAFKLKNLSR